MIRFDLDERYQDELVVGSAISRREGLIWSIVGHVLLVVLLVLTPRLAQYFELVPPVQQVAEVTPRENPMFVFVEPQLERPPTPPLQRPDLSDRDRRVQTPQKPPEAQNPLPFSRGDTTERVEPSRPDPPQPEPQPQAPPTPPTPAPEPPPQLATNAPTPVPQPQRPAAPARPPLTGVLGDAVRNLSRYTQNHTFSNPTGGNTDSTGAIQFDSKGADFGPWLRRFVAQVKRNWFVPLAAANFHGRVVLQFYVHRNGTISDVRVAQPSSIESFNRAAYNAIVGSNPTEPLPPEYPDDSVLFTVTFFYNEQPPL